MKKIDFIEGQNYEVWQSDSIVYTPPFKLMFECYLELLQNGQTSEIMPWRNSSLIIWVQNLEKEILGGICYDFVNDRKEGWINFTFTSPDHRRKGINSLCYSYFEQECIKKGMSAISGVISVSNTAALNSAKKVGRTPEFYRVSKRLQ